MDTRTGDIYTPAQLKALGMYEDASSQELRNYLTPMIIPPTEKQMARKPPKVGRNDMCPCGSGKKFKKCCLNTRRTEEQTDDNGK